MNTSIQFRWLLATAAGVLTIALAAGCQNQPPADVVEHGEDFTPNDTVRSSLDFVDAEAANAARLDATLRSYHFDSGQLNSLGQARLDSMLRNGNLPTPLVVYLDLHEEEATTAKSEQAVIAYLKDRGLTDDQIKLKSGPNPDVNCPVAPLLAAQAGAAAAPAAGAPH